MSKKTLFEEALADAKAVKNTALELAKQTLEEHFTPRLKKMVDSKLQESLEEEFEEDDDTSDEVDEVKKKSEEEKKPSEESKSGEDESINLEELLKELESEEDGTADDEVDESYGSEEKVREKGKPMDEKKSEDEPDEDDTEDIDEEKAQYLRLKEKFEPKKKSEEDKAPEEGSGEDEVDEDIDVEALLRELEGGDEEEKKSSEEDVDEEKYGASEEDGKKGVKPMDENLKALADKLKAGASGAIEDFKKDFEALKDPKKRQEWLQSLATTMGRIQGVSEKKDASEMDQIKSELNEAKLLNARLLYFGKLVKENEGLTKTDKLNLLRQLDKCTDTKQAKLVYETISGSFKAGKKSNTTKKHIKESMSFASKAAGTSTANRRSLNEDKEIVNSDLTNRWKFLAFGK